MPINSINAIRNINFTSRKKTQSPQHDKPRASTQVTKVLPVAIAMIPLGIGVTSCVQDNRNVDGAGWFEVATGWLSDADVKKINETREAPKNTVFKKVDETKTEVYTDSDGNTKTKKVKTGGWHYELVNNVSGLETGTTILPEGFTVKKDFLGIVRIVEDGTKSIFVKQTNEAEEEINKRDTIENDIDFLDAATGLLSDEQIEKINRTRVVPKGTIITKNQDGTYDIANDRLGLEAGTRLLPEGYEMRKNWLGVAKIVPVDNKSIYLKDKESTDTIKNTKDIDMLEAATKLLSDEQIKEINKTRRMPEGTVIAKDKMGNYYITSDLIDLETGTRTLPKGFEVKKNKLGVAVVVPKGTRGILLD